MITAEELAELLGELDDQGQPRVESIKDKASSKAWPSRLVNGKLRFLYPDDVDEIFEICKRGPEGKPKAEAAPVKRRSGKAATTTVTQIRGSGLADFRELPVANRRGTA